jgi:NCS1 family nucleobase:cation symporter-1
MFVGTQRDVPNRPIDVANGIHIPISGTQTEQLMQRVHIERRSIDYVPLAERHGKVWHLWPVWFSGSANLATLATGVIGVAMGGTLLWTGIAVLAGCALGTFFMAFHSTQGPQLGLPQMIQSRPQFGYMGALLVWVVALIAYIGFNAFNQVIAAQTWHQLYNAASPTSPVTIVVFAGCAVALAVAGYDKIHAAQRRFAFIVIALLGAFSLGALWKFHLPSSQWDPRQFREIPFLGQFFAAASYQLSWSIYVSDYSRYLPRNVGVGPSFWWTYLGAFLGGAWMMLVGSVAAALAPTLDMPAAIESAADTILPGFGPVLLGAALLGLLTISALNFYGASLTLLSVADSIRPLKCTVANRLKSLVVAAALAVVIALESSGDFSKRFNDLLAVLLYLFTPWTAINLVDFYWVRKGHYSIREIFNPRGIYGRWNWRGLVAYAVGFARHDPLLQFGPIYRSDRPRSWRRRYRHGDRASSCCLRLCSFVSFV